MRPLFLTTSSSSNAVFCSCTGCHSYTTECSLFVRTPEFRALITKKVQAAFIVSLYTLSPQARRPPFKLYHGWKRSSCSVQKREEKPAAFAYNSWEQCCSKGGPSLLANKRDSGCWERGRNAYGRLRGDGAAPERAICHSVVNTQTAASAQKHRLTPKLDSNCTFCTQFLRV
jgi:hypothetical protein